MALNFKIGDRVRAIEEPVFVTMYPNKVWKMHPRSDESCSFGRADLTHLIGEVGTVVGYLQNFMELGMPMEKRRCGWFDVEFDNEVAVPCGLNGFGNDELEHIKTESNE